MRADNVMSNYDNAIETFYFFQQFNSTMIRRMSSKRNVHHTRASASVDEESDSDSDSDEEQDRVCLILLLLLS